MADKRHLTDAIVQRLPPPRNGKEITLDDEVTGFGARVTAAGHRAFVLRYTTRAGRERVFTIGDATVWRTTAARAEAKRLRQLIDQGGDPLGDIEDERAAPTMAALIDRFVAEHVDERVRPSTACAYRGMIELHIRPHFGRHMKVADVQFENIEALHRKITRAGSPYMANRVVAVCSKMFSLAVRWRMRDDSPARAIERNYEAKRKRYIKPEELERLVAALASYPAQQVANVFRLLLLTGARRGEVLAIEWGALDLGAGIWTKAGSTVKQKTDHVVPLNAPARLLLSEMQDEYMRLHPKKPLPRYVFPGSGERGHVVEVKKAWRSICKAAGITGLRIHDLRHSFASQLASGGASLPLIGSLLGHTNPATTARYAHLFDDPQRKATESVGAIITAAAGKPPPAPPVELGRGRRL